MKIKSASVKDRIFIYYMIFFSLLSLLEITVNFSWNLGNFFNYKWLLIFFTALILMYIGIKAENKKAVQRITVYIAVLILYPAAWLDSPGIYSSGIIYSFPVMILINYFAEKTERIIINLLFIAVNIVMIYLSFIHGDLFKTVSTEKQIIDWMVSIPMVFLFSSFQIISIERAYERERKNSEKTSLILKEKSQTDNLTGLFNREHLAENWPDLITIHRRKNETISLIMFDLDFFKNYNDYYGHNQGDRCLSVFSSILKECMEREFDFAYRMGGEEFLVILGQTDEAGAVNVAEKIMKAMEKAAVRHVRSPANNYVTVTAGITSFQVSDTEKDFNCFLDEADKALYRGKETGRNRIVCYSENDFKSFKE